MTEEISEINDYIFKQDIGQGNFGKVKLEVYKPTNEEFAIKIINKKMIKLKMKNVIFKENEIITKFNHINVIYVYKIIDTPDNYYIVMEYCKKGELFDYIVKCQRIQEDEASIFFYQLINGVEYIHSQGIAHRDLKPENILLTEDKILKIIDFGLSHEFNGEDFLKTKCGSPSYASPEIITNPFYDGFKTDIWCCGIILYAMLCGYLPFDGDDNENNNNTLFKNIIDCKLDFPDYVNDLGKDLIYKLLTVEPDKRITISEIKNHPFYLKGHFLCNLDYELIEEEIIKKRIFNSNLNKNNRVLNTCYKNKNNSKEKVNNKKLLKIEITDNKNKNNTEENKQNNYIIEKIGENQIKDDKINIISINKKDLSPLNKRITNIINFHRLNKADINIRNNQILNTDSNLYNKNIISMLKATNNYSLMDKLLNTKINNTKTIEHDKLYSNVYLSTLNKDKEKKFNNFKPSFRDILKNDKNSLYFNVFGNNKNNKNILLNKLDIPEFFFDKKIQNSNDNKTFNDEIFLRNFRKNLFKKEKLNKKINSINNNDFQITKNNKTIDIEHKIGRIISLSNDNKKVKIKFGLKENNLNNIKNLIQNYEDTNIPQKNKNINTKLKIIPNNENNQKVENLSSEKYLKKKNKGINTDNAIDNSISNIKNNNNSYVNEKQININSICKETYIISLNKQHIYKSENNYKRKDLSLPKNYKKIDDKINLSKLIQNINHENESKKSVNSKKNKSFFNRYNLNQKTLESYSISNRNNTIENNRIPLNLTKKLRNFNLENNLNVKNIKEDLLNKHLLKNSRNLIKIKNNGIIKNNQKDFLPILTENNRNIRPNI